MKSLETVQKISKVLSILSIIAFVFTIIGAVGTLVGGIALMLLPGVLNASGLGDDFMELIIEGSGVESLEFLGIELIGTLFIVIAEAVVAFFVCRYFKNELADGTPFTYRGAKELLYLGIISLAVPFGGMIISSTINAVFLIKSNISNQFDITLGVVMILLSFVFKYGAELNEKKQAESNTENENQDA